MKLRHFAGYGTASATRIRSKSCTLAVRVEGNHERGLVRNDEYDLYHWLVRSFDKSVPDYPTWHRSRPTIIVRQIPEAQVDAVEYYFTC